MAPSAPTTTATTSCCLIVFQSPSTNLGSYQSYYCYCYYYCYINNWFLSIVILFKLERIKLSSKSCGDPAFDFHLGKLLNWAVNCSICRFCDHWRFACQRFSFLGAFVVYLESERLITRAELAEMLGG